MTIFTILELLNFDFCIFQPKENCQRLNELQPVNFLDFRFASFDFTENLSGRKIQEFPHCEATRYFSKASNTMISQAFDLDKTICVLLQKIHTNPLV